MFLVGVVIFYQELTVGFECLLTYLETMEDSRFSDMTKLRIKRVNRTNFLVVGNITYFVDAENEHEIESNILKKAGNKYQMTPFEKLIIFHEKVFVCPWPKVSLVLIFRKHSLTHSF